jgi:general secretion pathway protein I
MRRGFTLLEVMVALAIMALALTAIIGINGQTISAHTYAKRVTVATMLARSKMADLESQFNEEGFTSQFDQKVSGDFEEEGWNDFFWEAEIVKPELDSAVASELVQGLVQQYTQQAAEEFDRAQENADGPSLSLGNLGSTAIDQFRPMIEAQVAQLTETLEQSVREVRLKVYWREGREVESVDVVTHFVILPGAEWLPPKE